MPGFVLLSNPNLWPRTEQDVADWQQDIGGLERGQTIPIRWSTGSRRTGISEGDPVVLMSTGADGGILTIGRATGEIELAPHWDGSGRPAPFVVAEFTGWAGDRPLPRDLLRAELPKRLWPPRASGVALEDADMARVLDLWRDHTGIDPLDTPLRRGAAARTDAIHNRAVELRAMAVTRQAMGERGWTHIRDTSRTKPYDYTARTSDGRIRVEVKGLTAHGQTVELTHREVESARQHLTALAVVRGIVVERPDDNTAVGRGGSLTWELPWQPEAEQLEPVKFRYRLSQRQP